MDCVIDKCENDSEDSFCLHHTSAYENLKSSYSIWHNAFGESFSIKDYLTQIISNHEIETGIWVKDVANYLVDHERINESLI